jgi:sec-independent protein translocase protein TatC
LIYTSLTEAFFTYMKVAIFGAAFVSFPVVATQLWMFVAPGLYRSEKKAIAPFLVASPVLFVIGAAVVYYFVIPVAWKFFIGFEIPAESGGLPIELQPKIGEYLDLIMKLILAFGVAFQLPVALSLMAKVGIVSSAGLKKFRRYAVVVMTVVAAVLAPPDPGSMIMLAVPLMALYEISIVFAKIVEPKPQED